MCVYLWTFSHRIHSKQTWWTTSFSKINGKLSALSLKAIDHVIRHQLKVFKLIISKTGGNTCDNYHELYSHHTETVSRNFHLQLLVILRIILCVQLVSIDSSISWLIWHSPLADLQTEGLCRKIYEKDDFSKPIALTAMRLNTIQIFSSFCVGHTIVVFKSQHL